VAFLMSDPPAEADRGRPVLEDHDVAGPRGAQRHEEGADVEALEHRAEWPVVVGQGDRLVARPVAAADGDGEPGWWRPGCDPAQELGREGESTLRGVLVAEGAAHESVRGSWPP
jgi:hypothetical protein